MDQKESLTSDCLRREEITKLLKSPRADNSSERRIIQNFVLIWLDANIDEFSDDDLNCISQLRWTVNSIAAFTDADRCVDFLVKNENERIFMIVSGVLGSNTVPLIHENHQLDSIFVFSDDKSWHEQWTRNLPKVKGVYTQIAAICDSLKNITRQRDQNFLSISVVPPNAASKPNLDRLDQSFMYTQLLKESLLEINDDEAETIRKIADFWRANDPGSTTVAKFETEYHLHSPIWWYTFAGFLYSSVNRALRNLETDTILNIGFFICRLHEGIGRLHAKQLNDYTASFTVYRGQGLFKTDLEKLIKTNGGLMSFNSFLSTSQNEITGSGFLEAIPDEPDIIGILFEITVDPSISSPAAYALLQNDDSNFPDEKEVLFSTHTVFRIGKVEKIGDNNRRWRVILTLTSDQDLELTALMSRMQKETQEGSKGWSRLGKVLLKLGEPRKAQEIYQSLLDRESNEGEKAFFLNQIGYAKEDQGQMDGAIKHYEQALDIGKKILHPNDPTLATFYNNVGLAYKHVGEYSKTISFLEKALEIYQKTLSATDILLGNIYNNIGAAYEAMGDYPKALPFYEKDLEIGQKTLPSNHPDLATSYNNIGLIYNSMGEYSKALSFCEKALNIRNKSLPPTHRHLATSYNNVGLIYANLGEHPKAMSLYEKALEIRNKVLPPNHPDLAQSYNNIGYEHYHTKNYSAALSFYQKALEIRQNSVPPNPSDLVICYNNIGLVHASNTKHSETEALSFYKKALEITKTSLSPNHPYLATCYNNIGHVHHNKGDHSEALSYFENALKIRQETLRSDHPDLAVCYNNIGLVHASMNKHADALSCYEKALEIRQKDLAPNDPNLAIWYINIAQLCYMAGDRTKALEFIQKASGINPENFRPPN